MHTSPITPKIVFFDIDETLYQKETDTLRPSVYQALTDLKKKGILTAIATGRTPAALPKKIRQLIHDVGIDLLVTINGQYATYQGKPWISHPLDPMKIERLCRFLQQHQHAYAFVSTETIAVSEEIPEVEAALADILPDHPIDPDYFRYQPIYQMLGFYTEAEDAIIAPELAAIDYKAVRWHAQSVDLLDQAGSKARGIAEAIQRLGIEMHEVMAFGDGLNDLEMIQMVGFGVAMGNGHPRLKALADYICPSVAEDGVYQGLKTLGIID